MPRQAIVGCQDELSRSMALRAVTIFLMQAVSATFLCFPASTKRLVEVFDVGIKATCAHRAEVERGTTVSAAAADTPPKLAAVAIKGSDGVREAISRRLSEPSSGRSPMRVAAMELPMPGIEVSNSRLWRVRRAR